MPNIWRDCIKCGSDFYITEKAQDYIAKMKYELPKRCWKCREELRNERDEQRDEEKVWDDDGAKST